VSLAAGQSIAQARDVGANWLYTIHFFYQVAPGATLTVSYGAHVSQTFTGSVLGIWHEGIVAFALDAGESGGVTFAASGGACLVDSVTLLPGGLPISRADLVAIVADNLGSLATDAGLSTTASASGPEGDYTLNLNDALRAMGAVSTFGSAALQIPTGPDDATWGDPDVTQLDMAEIGGVVELVTESLMVQVRNSYAGEVDVSLGPRNERRSQLVTNINALLGGGKGGKGGASGKSVGVGRLTNSDWPH
jgi:hypothetical protein